MSQDQARAARRDVAPEASPGPARTQSDARPAISRGVVIGAVLAVIAVIAAVVTLSGGGDSGKQVTAATSSSPEASPTTASALRTKEQVASDEAATHTVVLQLSDLPPLWQAFPADPSLDAAPSALARDNAVMTCVGVTPSSPIDPPTHLASDLFADATGHQALGEVTFYANAAAAKDDFSLLKERKLPGCIASLINRSVTQALAASGQAIDPRVNIGEAGVSDLHIGDVHTNYIALRQQVPIQAGTFSLRVAVDLVVAIQDRAVVTLTFLTLADALPVDFEAGLVNAMIDRLP